jgi:hypothetical protein
VKETIDWADFQWEMGYTDEELAMFRANPKAVRLLERVDKMADWDIIAEVMEAPGCANHKPGDKIILSPLGLLRAHEGPETICVHALPPLSVAVAVMQERCRAFWLRGVLSLRRPEPVEGSKG